MSGTLFAIQYDAQARCRGRIEWRNCGKGVQLLGKVSQHHKCPLGGGGDHGCPKADHPQGLQEGMDVGG